ncbi:sugar phosphate isomerase/epimerase family protein [Paenibacillus humicola]|uniref:sugar phosphate isomerase/epimerase family protein n=1 Tax=Paenibacillus humicola TaxID=3110540 RepID=UPI00237AD73F|nr:sugar phosphate isomerase/epimerase [Paenibacillus humicola]
MKFGLTAYGTVFYMGIHPKATRPRFTAKDQIDMAEAYGLQGVELPYDTLRSGDADETAEYVRSKGMFLNIAAGGYDTANLKEAMRLANRVGAITVRTVVGGAKIGGDRRLMAGQWQPFLQTLLRNFGEVMAAAEPGGANLAVENHQDLASEELLWLCEQIGSKQFGITLDTGNPLATAEEPVDFFRRVAPHVRNVHLKDYNIFWSEEGYRLARCPLGQGVIDFPALLGILSEANPGVTLSVEHGALEARHIRVLMEDYWTEYPPRTALQLTRLLRFVEDHARSRGDWRTPYEKGESPEAIAAYEIDELNRGTAYLAALMKQYA